MNIEGQIPSQPSEPRLVRLHTEPRTGLPAPKSDKRQLVKFSKSTEFSELLNRLRETNEVRDDRVQAVKSRLGDLSSSDAAQQLARKLLDGTKPN